MRSLISGIQPARVVLLGAIAAVSIAAVVVIQVRNSSPPSIATQAVPTTAGSIEERWGVRFTQIGVTADGGLIDVRYQVLDPDKATVLTRDEDHLPVLVDEGSGKVINSAALMPNHNVQAGRTYFVLYRNTDGAIAPGNQVSIVLGGQRLEHMVAW